ITNWYKNNVSTTVLYMPFEGVNGNEANNATDYSGYGNNGTVFGATWNRTGGKIGGAYDFDGNDDYIKIPASTSINFKDKANFSIEAWVKPDSFGENISGRIFQKGNSYLLTQRVNASIFSSDFEGSDSNLCNGGDGWTTGLCDSGNTAVGNEQTIVYSGLYAAKFTTTGTADTARVAKSLTTGYQTLYIRFYFKLDYEDLSSFGQLTLLHLQDSVAWQDIQIGIKDNGDGTYDLGTSDANLVEYDDDAAEHLLLDTWYSIETKIYRHPTAGTIDVWLDGVNVASDTGLDTGDNNIDYIWLGIDYANSNNNQVVIDDLVIDDQYIGPTQNVTLSCNVDLATTDANANTTTTISVNRWGLVACNYNNLTKNVSIYINGTEAAYSNRQQGSGALSDDSSSDMYVGSNNGVFAYDGTIDEFRIYNYTLSQNQIYQDYLAGLANRTSNILVFNEITLNDQWLCSVTPNDGYADGQTKNSTTVTITQANNAPSISAFALKPTIANTSSNIQCNATISDAEQSTVTVEYWWYNSSVFVLGGNKTGVAVNSNIIISTLGNGNTTKGETWNCTIRAFDGELYSSYNSTAITIQNAPPSTPALVSPTNGNLTYHDRTPEFSWTSTDADGDPINYTINITFSSTLSCGPDIWKNLTANSYTGAFDYCTDQVVYWQVIASDPYSSSSWSNLSNFTIESFLSINLTTRSIDFGILHLMDERNTASGYAPIVIENIGNIFVNIARIGANGSLWQSLGLDTEYFQFKADNLSTHPDSFNYTNSTTEWTNVTSVQTANATILRDLNYSDDHNAAEIDIKVVVPLEEPPGSRSVTLYIMGEQS
ncbi:MAG: LamG-like jellyroll fold domain-containing protein, partial [archaeon]